jgi:hypothetical protein
MIENPETRNEEIIRRIRYVLERDGRPFEADPYSVVMTLGKFRLRDYSGEVMASIDNSIVIHSHAGCYGTNEELDELASALRRRMVLEELADV